MQQISVVLLMVTAALEGDHYSAEHDGVAIKNTRRNSDGLHQWAKEGRWTIRKSIMGNHTTGCTGMSSTLTDTIYRDVQYCPQKSK